MVSIGEGKVVVLTSLEDDGRRGKRADRDGGAKERLAGGRSPLNSTRPMVISPKRTISFPSCLTRGLVAFAFLPSSAVVCKYAVTCFVDR